MRICLATFRHEFRNSGEIESIINLQHYLRKNNISADILTPQGFYKHHMVKSRSGFFLGKGFDLLRLYIVLQQYSRNYDIIHLFLPFPSFSFYGDFIKYRLRKKVVVTFESCILTTEGAGFKNLLRYETLSNLLRLCINNKVIAKAALYSADAYIVSSKYQKNQLSIRNVDVIPNLTNNEVYKKINKDEVRKSFNFPVDVIVISYIGHFLEIKGISDFLKAFAILSRNNDNVMAALAFSSIGRLDMVKKMTEHLNIEGKVMFFGSVNVPEFMSASDLLVLPYRYSFGTNWIPSTLLEGFSIGVPILTSDIAPLRELNNDDKEVLYFAKAGDPYDFAYKINILIKNKDEFKTVIQNQQVMMETKLNPDILAKHYINIYKAVLDEKD